MSIKIIEEPDVTVTRSQYEMYKREWEKSQAYTVKPSSLEDYIRRQLGLYVL